MYQLGMFKKYQIFTMTKMKIEWNINFFQNSPLNIPHTYSSEFSIGWSTAETSLLKLCNCISFDVHHVFKSLLKWIFHQGYEEKHYTV